MKAIPFSSVMIRSMTKFSRRPRRVIRLRRLERRRTSARQ